MAAASIAYLGIVRLFPIGHPARKAFTTDWTEAFADPIPNRCERHGGKSDGGRRVASDGHRPPRQQRLTDHHNTYPRPFTNVRPIHAAWRFGKSYTILALLIYLVTEQSVACHRHHRSCSITHGAKFLLPCPPTCTPGYGNDASARNRFAGFGLWQQRCLRA